jgi:hypothetical protein
VYLRFHVCIPAEDRGNEQKSSEFVLLMPKPGTDIRNGGFLSVTSPRLGVVPVFSDYFNAIRVSMVFCIRSVVDRWLLLCW